ncbi:MAG: hypothetical protein EZS28_033396, partial [Streblomastix strix]
MRPAEIEGISQRHSVICEHTDKVDLRLQPKTKTGLHSHKLPKTKDRTVCPRATFFDWLKKIDNKHGRSIRDNKYGALCWNEDKTIPAKRGQISLRLKKLLDLMDIKGKQDMQEIQNQPPLINKPPELGQVKGKVVVPKQKTQ